MGRIIGGSERMASKTHKDGYWKDQENVIAEARAIMRKHRFKRLPNEKKLVALGYAGFTYAVQNHYNGMRSFRELLGDASEDLPSGKLNDESYVLSQLRLMIDENKLDHFPTPQDFAKFDMHSLEAGVNRYHDRQVLAKKLKVSTVNRKKRVWTDENYVLEQARKFLREEKYNELPSGRVLTNLGYSSLWTAIVRYHGGVPKVRELLNLFNGVTHGESLLELYNFEYSTKFLTGVVIPFKIIGIFVIIEASTTYLLNKDIKH
jgi:hypothetical protein